MDCKICSKCKIIKEVSAFSILKRTRKPNSWCTACIYVNVKKNRLKRATLKPVELIANKMKTCKHKTYLVGKDELFNAQLEEVMRNDFR